MAVQERHPKGIPAAEPSRQALADQVEDVLGAIRAELGEEEDAPLDDILDERLSRPSIPEWLAPAIVISEPPSPIDAWARGEIEDDGDPIAIADEPSSSPDDGPLTLRPSSFSLPAHRPPRTTSRWLLSAVLAGCLGAAIAWQLARATPLASTMAVTASDIAASQSPPAPTIGGLTVTTLPEARLFIDDRDHGTTRTFEDLAPGSHRLRLEARGHEPHERRVEIAAGKQLDLEISLAPKPHHLVVEVDPPEAFVMISRDGGLGGHRYAAPWPRTIEVEPGDYTVVAFLKGRDTVLRPVEVRANGEPVVVRIRLPQAD